VEFTIEAIPDGTRLTVRETSPEFSTALALRSIAGALAAPATGKHAWLTA
jgi:hypothetical protein